MLQKEPAVMCIVRYDRYVGKVQPRVILFFMIMPRLKESLTMRLTGVAQHQSQQLPMEPGPSPAVHSLSIRPLMLTPARA